MRTEKETGRRALARFRLHTLSMTPDARKNVREIVGRQNFSKKRFKKTPKSLDFEEKKKNNLSLDFWLGAYRQQGWIGKTRGELGERLLLLLKAGRIISRCPISPRVS